MLEKRVIHLEREREREIVNSLEKGGGPVDVGKDWTESGTLSHACSCSIRLLLYLLLFNVLVLTFLPLFAPFFWKKEKRKFE